MDSQRESSFNFTSAKKFTAEKLRTYKGLENISDEEAQEAIDTLEQFAIMIITLYSREKNRQQNYKSKTEGE